MHTTNAGESIVGYTKHMYVIQRLWALFN